MIKIKNLSKKYNDQYALKDVDLELPSKGLIGISGESGSGKSTLLNALALMDNNYQGEIIINKKNILKYNSKKIDKYHLNIGYIFQTPYLFNFLSVKENITFLSLIKGKKDNIDNILKKVGLIKYKDKKVNALSGGQRQRVSIAMSLISKPKILLCDEPTGALDSDNSVKIMEILKEVSKDILVIIVSHDLKLLKEYSDSLIYLENGEVKETYNLNKCENTKIKFKRKNIFSYLKFIFKFSLKNVIYHKKRTLLTSMMVSFGLVGLVLSILLKDGFSSFFETSLGSYESNKYMYCYNIKNEDLKVELDTFETDFKDYNKGYFYKYDFKDENNKITINDKDLHLNLNHLSYLIKDNEYIFNDNEIGLNCSKEYIDYIAYLLNVNKNQINSYLNNNHVKLNIKYLDNIMNLNFNLRLKYVKESKEDYTYFIHSNTKFLKEYYKNYLSNNLENNNKIIMIPYIESNEEDKNDLLVSENKKKYDYLFDNEIYGKKYDFVFKSSYYRIDINLAQKMSEMIDSSYFISLDKGISMLGYFDNNIKVSSNEKEIKAEEISFVPSEYNFKSIYEISISSALYKLLNSNIISLSIDDIKQDFKVIDIIESNNLIIYQNSYWSYSLFKDVFNYKEYECIGLAIGFSKCDDESKEILSNEYKDFEFICPLKEVKKEIDNMVSKIQLVLVILSMFCIIISLLLLAIIIFINTLEQSKLIALLRVNGIRKIDVVFIFIFESILLGLISFIISSYFAFIFSIELNLAFNMMLESNEMKNIINIKKDTLINVFLIVISMPILSSFIPSFSAARKKSLMVLKS